MRVSGAVHSAAWVVFAQLGNTKSGTASPQMGETAPLIGAYSIVSGGLRSRPGFFRAARVGDGHGVLPPVHRLLKAVSDYRDHKMFVVVVNHLLGVDMVVVVADNLPVPVPVAGHGNGCAFGAIASCLISIPASGSSAL